MTASRSLPARPSLESLRNQARKLVRDTTAGDAGASARARAHLPHVELPLTQRNAQLVIAREYGFAGWQDLTAEVHKRLGSLEWATTQARRAIHDNDIARLQQLLAEYPALLSWRGDDGEGGLLQFATDAYGDAFAPNREEAFTRAACAELLIDVGAVVLPSVCEGILNARARGLLRLFQRKGLLPRSLKFLAALGDIDAIRNALAESDLASINEAFMTACNFEQETVASMLLERSLALDADLRKHIHETGGPHAFVRYVIENRQHFRDQKPDGLWQIFVSPEARVRRALHDGDLSAFVSWFQQEPALLGKDFVQLQADLIAEATFNHRGDFIEALFDLSPAILLHEPPPPSQAIEFALTYGTTHLMPLLTRIWPLPDDLPHAAGMGDLARVKRWFDPPVLGDLEQHYPYNDARARGHLNWNPRIAQQILDTALAFSVINHHFDVADFLLEHGADINTNWNSHEPASILHHLVFQDDYEAMQFLIDRGIDMTIRDYRWNSNAQGWARHGKQDEPMAQWLERADRQRQHGAR